MSCLLCSSTRLRLAFSASKAFAWRTGSPHPLQRRGCGVELHRESPKGAEQQQRQQQQRSCKKKGIDDTHCCHRMTVRAAGGRRTGCGAPGRSEQQQQQQHSSIHTSIGAVVACDRVSWGVVRDAAGLKNFFGMCGSDCSIEKVGIEKAPFRLRKNTRFGLKPPFSIHRSDWIRTDLKVCF